VALGVCEGKKKDGDNALVYTLHGDGELQEGQIWEALMYAAAKKVDNIISTIDYNGRQIDGDTEDVLSLGNLHAKLEAFGWLVLEEKNGNDLEAVIAILEKAKSETGKGKPVVIILHTEMGYGVDYMMGTHAWHGKAPNDEQLNTAFKQLYLEAPADY
jgi:transketolase